MEDCFGYYSFIRPDTSAILLFFLKVLWLIEKSVSVTSLILSRVISDSIFLIFVSRTTGLGFFISPLFFPSFFRDKIMPLFMSSYWFMPSMSYTRITMTVIFN